MGLDGVELVMDIEDEFGLTIPDDEAFRLETVGDVIDYIVARLRERAGPPAGGCPSARTFYRLRAELAARLGVPRGAVRRGRTVGELVPPGPGRRGWTGLARAVGLRPEPFNILRPLWGRFLPAGLTVGELIRTRGARAGTTYVSGTGHVDVPAVTNTIRRMTARQAGVEYDDVRRESHLVRDLHLD